ncbi:MAG: PTS transporter subunit EIIC [Mycoplasmatales bacterium]
MNGKIMSKLSQIGQAFMLPIALLPAAGLMLGVGGSLTNENNLKSFTWLDNPIIQVPGQIMSNIGNSIFSNLFILIAIGLAIGLCKKNKAVAGLSAFIGIIVMNETIKTLISIFGEKDQVIDTGAVGAIAIAFLASYATTKFYDAKVPDFLGFFSGERLVPIMMTILAPLIGVVFFFIWPFFQAGLVSASNAIGQMGYIGTFLYGFLLRLSGAFGLHHMIYPLFWWTSLGGTAEVAGQTVEGAQYIFFAQLADPNHVGLFTEGTKYFAGRFATMMFGLPGAALAMYHALPSTLSTKKRKMYAGLFLSVALTSFTTGITEPLEFMFLFVAPFLYVWHAFLDGLSFMVADILNINIGNTFSGGVIDFTLFGILQGQAQTNWLYVLIVGPIWFVIYYYSFKFFITKFNIMTPGRNPNEAEEEMAFDSKDSLSKEAQVIVENLGGIDNIVEVDACITRLRVNLVDITKIDKDALMTTGARGIIEVGSGVQIIYGAKAAKLRDQINKQFFG